MHAHTHVPITIIRNHAKALYRSLVTLGTIVYGDASTMEMAISLEIPSLVADSKARLQDNATDEALKQVLDEVSQALLPT